MKKASKLCALSLCAVMAAGTAVGLAGCGGSGDYTIWLYSAQSNEYYSDYAENPVLNYLLADENGEKEFSIEFLVPPSDPQGNYSTMITSGDFPTLMQNSVADPAPVMYDNGYILDLTDLVEQYMPNYKALIDSNPKLKEQVVYNIDGEEKILSLAIVNESNPYNYEGMVYRRDWIVEYGTNSSTGAKFTGGFTDDGDVDSWEDDVVFPSWYDETKRTWYQTNVDADWDGSDPAYISDWEWMFDIFETALADLGITDGYCTSIYYEGYTWSGGLNSCFGEGSLVWYADTDNQVKFGGTESSTKAYFDCVHNWYEEGWLDKSFANRSGDQHFSIDDGSVRSGKVGMWCGLESTIGGRLRNTDSAAAENFFGMGCCWPINDVYGTSENQYVVPHTTRFGETVVPSGFYLMNSAEGMDLEPLLTFLDYLYTEEGAVARTLGLSKEQLDEGKVDTSFYDEFGLSDGAYTIGEDGRYRVSDVLVNDSGSLSIAASLDKLPGLQLVESVDYGYAETYEDTLRAWSDFPNKGGVFGSIAMGNMDPDEYSEVQTSLNRVLEYMKGQAYRFIEDGMSDSDWSTWCSMLGRYNVDDISDLLQPYIDEYPIA